MVTKAEETVQRVVGMMVSVVIVVGTMAAAMGHAQVIDASRGVDSRVDYQKLVQYGPWDDRNYSLTLEDLEWLAPNESELTLAIPAFFRVEMRKSNPKMLRSGPVQYPRSAPEIFRQVHRGLLVDGVYVGAERAAVADVPVNGEVLVEPGAESAIAVKPTDPSVVIAGFNTDYPRQRMVYSTDGGATWTFAADLPSSCCDPTVGWSTDGLIAYTATLKNCSFSGCGVSAYRSTDNGQTWTNEGILTSSGSDKEYLHVDSAPSSPYKDYVYLTWHDSNVLQFARSMDKGLTWSSPLSFSSDATGIGSDIATDSAGRIFYVWPATGARQIKLKVSTDGGATFAPATTIDTTEGSFDFPIPVMETRRAWIYVATDVDLSAGPYADSVYTAWTDTSGPEGSSAADNHTVVKVAYSRDHGVSWTVVTPHATADVNEVDRFNHWMEVDAQGVIHLVYYTTEYVHPSRNSVDLAYQYSQDGGVTWSAPSRITSVSSPNIVDGFEFGDYNGLDITAATVIPIWTDNRSETLVDSIDVYVADVTNVTGTPDFYLSAQNLTQSICAPGSLADIPIEVGVFQSFSNPVTLAYQGLPSGFSGGIVGSPVNPPPGTATAQLAVAGGTTPGPYAFGIVGTAPGSDGHDLAVSVSVYGAAASQPTLLTPADGATDQPSRPTFSWTAAANAATYSLQVATDAAFTSIVLDESGIADSSFTPASDLATNTQLYWRVQAVNPCGSSTPSAPFDFITAALPGDCDFTSTPVVHFFDDLESGAAGWTHSGLEDTWAISDARVWSGSSAFLGIDVGIVSDQELVSPPVVLPLNANGLTLQFYTWQEMEDSTGGCFDGGLLEISTNDGGSWTQVTAGLTTDPYDGPVSDGFSNPMMNLDAWCGDPQDWLRSVVDLSPWAGQTVRFKFRLGTDSSVSREGWYIDDVKVQSCNGPGIFANGFESGLTDAWSYTQP